MTRIQQFDRLEHVVLLDQQTDGPRLGAAGRESIGEHVF